MDNCIFCTILRGEAEGIVIEVSKHWIGLVPKEQVSKGHTLLIPKKHFKDVFDLGENEVQEFGAAIQKLSKELVGDNNATAINLLNASGIDAQQSVFHFHMHLVPRYPDDGLDLWIKQEL